MPLALHNTALGITGWAAGRDGVVSVRGVDLAEPGGLLIPALEMRLDLAWDSATRRWSGVARAGVETGTVTLEPASWDESLAAVASDATPPTAVGLPDGRWMHLDCRGSGAPTVILDAGASRSASDWREVHDAIAETTRACAFDRAGLGLSDVGPQPRDAAAAVADERAMLAAAGIEGPYVLVGHSLAGLHVRFFANSHLDDVAGIVLVDPASPFQVERIVAAAPRFAQLFSFDQSIFDATRKCAVDMRAGFLTRTAAGARGCFSNDPDLMETQISEAGSMGTSSSQEVAITARSYGALPLIVLTAGDWADDAPPDFTDEEKTLATGVWRELHEETAALSSIGEHRIVPESRHDIHLQQPDAVVDAINDVVAAARARD